MNENLLWVARFSGPFLLFSFWLSIGIQVFQLSGLNPKNHRSVIFFLILD